MLAPLTLLATAALGAEVVWLGPPGEGEAALVGRAAGAVGPPLTPLDLRAAATRWTEADEQHLRDLALALTGARAYEDDLDGELLILRDLDAPIARIAALRDEADRAALFAALAYQGFAANRYFADQLATDPAAEPWRAMVLGTAVERPWVDAAALEPERDATPYEIAEAPQRIAYNGARQRLLAVIPATLTPVGLPPGASLVVDGRPIEVGPTGNLKVRPGRHLAHLLLEGRIVARWDVRLEPGADAKLQPPVSEGDWQAFLASPAAPIAEPIADLVDAIGGEVWLARSGEELEVVAVTREGVHRVDLQRAEPTPNGPPEGGVRPVFGFGALGGWLTSGDFYTQDPTAPNTRATVNAVTVGGWAEAGVAAGHWHAEAGADVLVPLGPYHVALSGDGVHRVRPIPYVGGGVGPVGVAGGFLFPYHPAVGGHLTVPIGPLVARGTGWVGLPVVRRRADGSDWHGLPVITLTTGLGARF